MPPAMPSADELACVARAGPSHAQLQHRLEQLGDLSGALDGVDTSLYALRGKLFVQAQRLRVLDKQSKASFVLVKAHRLPHQRLMLRVRRQLHARLAAQEQAWHDAHQTESDVRDEVASLLAEVEAAQTRKALLELQRQEQRELLQQLDKIHASLFLSGSGMISHPHEQATLYQHKVLTALSEMLHNEAEREKQLRTTYLDKSQRLAKELLTCVRSAIGNTTETRIGSHIPTAREMALGHEYEMTRTITPTLQQAKILSGKMHTTMATARVFNAGVAPLPDMSIVDLQTLPTRKAAEHHKRSLHRTLEASFAQATWCINHCSREKERSTLRQRRLTEESRGRRTRAESARTQLRFLRAQIIDHVCNYSPQSKWNEDEAQRCWSGLALPLERVMGRDEGAPPSFGGALPSVHTSAQNMVRSLLASVRTSVDDDLPPLQGRDVLTQQDVGEGDPEWYLDPNNAGYEYFPGSERMVGNKQAAPSRLMPQPLRGEALVQPRPAPVSATASSGLAPPPPTVGLQRTLTPPPPPPHPDHAHLAQ